MPTRVMSQRAVAAAVAANGMDIPPTPLRNGGGALATGALKRPARVPAAAAAAGAAGQQPEEGGASRGGARGGAAGGRWR